jgi:redox-sensitive bicupin YhaK (pirin superfamily)
MLDGVLEHRDSNGGGGLITDGATQWMTAGAGIVHSELPTEEIVTRGGLFHGVQLWVNLPAAQKWSPAQYQDIEADRVTLVASHDAGAVVRLIAGDLGDVAGPGRTRTPITYAHASVSPGSRLVTPWRTDFNALAYVLAGHGSAGAERTPIREGQIAVFAAGDALELAGAEVSDGRSERLEVVLLGGQPIREAVAWHGPFVMNTREEIFQAIEDYHAGRMGSIPARNAPEASDGVQPD